MPEGTQGRADRVRRGRGSKSMYVRPELLGRTPVLTRWLGLIPVTVSSAAVRAISARLEAWARVTSTSRVVDGSAAEAVAAVGVRWVHD